MTTKNIFKIMMMLLGVIALGIISVSCGDDDDDNISKESIIGKWYYEKEIVNGVEKIDEKFDCKTKKDYREFLANGIMKYVNYTEDCEEKVEDDGSEIWKLSGKYITLTEKLESETDEVIFSITKLTQNSLVIHIEKFLENGKEILVDVNEDKKADDVTIYLKKLQ